MPCIVLTWCLMYCAFVKRRTPPVRFTVNADVIDSSIEATISSLRRCSRVLLLLNHGKAYLLELFKIFCAARSPARK